MNRREDEDTVLSVCLPLSQDISFIQTQTHIGATKSSFPSLGKTPDTHSLKERFYVAHGSGVQSVVGCSKTGVSQQKGVVEESCSVHVTRAREEGAREHMQTPVPPLPGPP